MIDKTLRLAVLMILTFMLGIAVQKYRQEPCPNYDFLLKQERKRLIAEDASMLWNARMYNPERTNELLDSILAIQKRVINKLEKR